MKSNEMSFYTFHVVYLLLFFNVRFIVYVTSWFFVFVDFTYFMSFDSVTLFLCFIFEFYCFLVVYVLSCCPFSVLIFSLFLLFPYLLSFLLLLLKFFVLVVYQLGYDETEKAQTLLLNGLVYIHIYIYEIN